MKCEGIQRIILKISMMQILKIRFQQSISVALMVFRGNYFGGEQVRRSRGEMKIREPKNVKATKKGSGYYKKWKRVGVSWD